MDDFVIRRAPHQRKYVVIANDPLRDDRLSFKARGLLALLLSMPDSWRVSADWLASQSTEGRKSVLSGLRELETAGYLKRWKYQDQLGRWVNESIVSETPNAQIQPVAPQVPHGIVEDPDLSLVDQECPVGPEVPQRTSGKGTSEEVPHDEVRNRGEVRSNGDDATPEGGVAAYLRSRPVLSDDEREHNLAKLREIRAKRRGAA